MQIKKLVINNYRNLDGQKVSFADNCNFIVGENNPGKSNLLSIFQIIFTNRAFKYFAINSIKQRLMEKYSVNVLQLKCALTDHTSLFISVGTVLNVRSSKSKALVSRFFTIIKIKIPFCFAWKFIRM
jgi:recombinational DNA repair ATPase RecF